MNLDSNLILILSINTVALIIAYAAPSSWGSAKLIVLVVLSNITAFLVGARISTKVFAQRMHKIIDEEISNLHKYAEKQEEEELEELKKKEKESGLEILEKE